MKDPLKSLSKHARARVRRAKQPDWVQPMLATLAGNACSRKDWIYERKLDGERCLAFRRGRRIRLRSRNRRALNATYPELVEAMAGQRCQDFVVDGEVVAFRRGVTSFARLQQRMQITRKEEARRSRVAVYYYLFDILHLNGRDLTRLPLADRKRLLMHTFAFSDPVRLTIHRSADGEALLRQACRKNWEGLIAKRSNSCYHHGRSRDWLKFKCARGQEFVIGGYTNPKGSRTGFGALLLGYHEGATLRYAGRVGTGFDENLLRRLGRRLARLTRKTPPFADGQRLPARGVHWTTPKLVAEIGFTEWTNGRLRHPRFLGLRRDKRPTEVVRERGKV